VQRPNDNHMSSSERRRRKKQAEKRVQAWEQIRNSRQSQVSGQYPFNAPLTPPEPARYTAEPRGKNLLGVLGRAGVGVSLSVALAGASPLVSGAWNWAALGIALVFFAVLLRVCSGKGDRRARIIGWTLAGALVTLTGVGALTQNVSDGNAVPVGSVKDRTIDELKDIEQAVYVMQENQKLLYLAPEQALGIQSAYTKAHDQAIYVMERWNPVTADGSFDVDVLLLMTDLNAAAARQAAAFEAFTVNLTRPEQAVEAKMQSLRAETEQLVDKEVGPKLRGLQARYGGRYQEEKP